MTEQIGIKMSKRFTPFLRHFEVRSTRQHNRYYKSSQYPLFMVTSIPLKNIEEEQKTDQATVEQISKIIRFLWNIED
ncbi:MAG: hypothetical protein ACLQO7_04755 [Candidatus Bathyarchaeia archaeon]